jgi:hypothetical protein
MAEIYSDPRQEQQSRGIAARAETLGKTTKQLDAEVQALTARVAALEAAAGAPDPDAVQE